jgi:DNA primase
MGRYKCWSCGESGDIFNWVMKTQNVEFAEALQILADQAGVTLSNRPSGQPKTEKAAHESAMADALGFFREQLAKSVAARGYLEKRGLDSAVVSQWEIGYAPDVGDALATHLKRKGHPLAVCRALFLVDEDPSGGYYDKFRGRLMFPIRDERGGLVAFGGRLLGDGQPKYINSSDTPLYRKGRVLYGLNVAKERLAKESRAVLVEGYLDVIACHRAGVQTAVASLGTALSEDHAKLLKRWADEVVILYDSDAAGQKAADRAIEVLGKEGVRIRVALMPDGEDPDTLLRVSGPAAVQKSVESGLSPLDYRLRALERILDPSQEEFWTEVIGVLATAPNEMELDRHLVRLAAMYPGLRDQVQAQKDLRSMVLRHRRQAKRPSPEPTATRPRPTIAPLGIKDLRPAELVILGALYDDQLRRLAWETAAETSLFTSKIGAELATAIRTSFPDGPPAGIPATWLGRIEPEAMREEMIRLETDPRVDRITPNFFEGSVAHLREQLEKRSFDVLKNAPRDDQALVEIQNRLRKLKKAQE